MSVDEEIPEAAPVVMEAVEMEEMEEMEEIEEKPKLPRLSTVGFDARFPNMNQTKNCWQNYVDYFKCVEAKGDEFVPCLQFKKAYTILCPTKWAEKWDEQRENNVFPPLVKKAESHH